MYELSEFICKLTGVNDPFYTDYLHSKNFREYMFAAEVLKKVSQEFNYAFSEETFKKFLIFAAWLRIVDDELENNKMSGRRYLEIFELGTCDTNKPGEVLTKAIYILTKDNRSEFTVIAKDLYYSVVEEANTKSMREFIKLRGDNGEKIVNFAVEIFDSEAKVTHPEFITFFRNWVRTGNLMDSIIDFKKDLNSGVYKFPVSFLDKGILILFAIANLLRSVARYPFMFKYRSLYKELKFNADH